MNLLPKIKRWPAALIVLTFFLSTQSFCLVAQETALEDDIDLIAAPANNAGLEFLNEGSEPNSVDQLRAMEKVFADVVELASSATVNIAVAEAQGSGVVVSRDGYILTAAHVISRPNLAATITFADGSKASAITLGVNRAYDSGMLKITDKGKWPFLEIGESNTLSKGQWVMAIGHPGGLTEGRGLVYRAGRILNESEGVLTTDCTLVGGDSGGPLVDLNGLVVGIHSRIGGRLWENFHVPIDAFSIEWDELSDRVIVGSTKAYIGIELEKADGLTNKIKDVVENEGAANAGMKVGDIIIKVNEFTIDNRMDLRKALGKLKPKDTAKIVVKRGEEELELEVTLGYQ